MGDGAKSSEIGCILTSDDGFAWDVALPRDPSRYDARTILSMVKSVNRGGRVRWFEVRPDGREYRWKRGPFDIKGEDDLPAFVAALLEGRSEARLVISFEDRSDARAFVRDLDSLNVSRSALKQLQGEYARRREIAASHTPDRYPPALRIARSEGSGEHVGYGWLVMVKAESQCPRDINIWMRRNILERYWVGLWRADGDLQMAKVSWRYWRLSEHVWARLIASMRPADRLLVNFHSSLDYEVFDRTYGPGQFLRR